MKKITGLTVVILMAVLSKVYCQDDPFLGAFREEVPQFSSEIYCDCLKHLKNSGLLAEPEKIFELMFDPQKPLLYEENKCAVSLIDIESLRPEQRERLRGKLLDYISTPRKVNVPVLLSLPGAFSPNEALQAIALSWLGKVGHAEDIKFIEKFDFKGTLTKTAAEKAIAAIKVRRGISIK